MSNMTQFGFYIDDDRKKKALEKLERLCGPTDKGKLAAFLRVCIDEFVAMSDEDISPEFKNKVVDEYVYSATKNKRSKM